MYQLSFTQGGRLLCSARRGKQVVKYIEIDSKYWSIIHKIFNMPNKIFKQLKYLSKYSAENNYKQRKPINWLFQGIEQGIFRSRIYLTNKSSRKEYNIWFLHTYDLSYGPTLPLFIYASPTDRCHPGRWLYNPDMFMPRFSIDFDTLDIGGFYKYKKVETPPDDAPVRAGIVIGGRLLRPTRRFTNP